MRTSISGSRRQLDIASRAESHIVRGTANVDLLETFLQGRKVRNQQAVAAIFQNARAGRQYGRVSTQPTWLPMEERHPGNSSRLAERLSAWARSSESAFSGLYDPPLGIVRLWTPWYRCSESPHPMKIVVKPLSPDTQREIARLAITEELARSLERGFRSHDF